MARLTNDWSTAEPGGRFEASQFILTVIIVIKKIISLMRMMIYFIRSYDIDRNGDDNRGRLKGKEEAFSFSFS